MTQGAWQIITHDKPKLQLTTSGLPMTLAVKAPIISGSLVVAAGVDFVLELALLQLEAANLAAKFGVGAARNLIKERGGDDLRFEAQAPGESGPWHLTGIAYAGTLEIPMTVIATPDEHMASLHIGGTIELDDVEIPLPGLSGVNSITFALDGRVGLRTA